MKIFAGSLCSGHSSLCVIPKRNKKEEKQVGKKLKGKRKKKPPENQIDPPGLPAMDLIQSPVVAKVWLSLGLA
jgi:hypothetical protein